MWRYRKTVEAGRLPSSWKTRPATIQDSRTRRSSRRRTDWCTSRTRGNAHASGTSSSTRRNSPSARSSQACGQSRAGSLDPAKSDAANRPMGNPDGERRADADGALNANFAVVRLDELARDREPQAGPLRARSFVKTLEDS